MYASLEAVVRRYTGDWVSPDHFLRDKQVATDVLAGGFGYAGRAPMPMAGDLRDVLEQFGCGPSLLPPDGRRQWSEKVSPYRVLVLEPAAMLVVTRLDSRAAKGEAGLHQLLRRKRGEW